MGRCERVVALDLTSKGFAFGILESEERLVDWGTRECGRRVSLFLPALSAVVERYRPDRLVIEEPAGSLKKRQGRDLLVWAEQWAHDNDLAVATISQDQLDRYFGSEQRYVVASAVARHFERLTPQLPPARKRWESERVRLSVFVAVGRGLASFRQR